MTDESLILTVARAQQGDSRAFDLLVHRFQNMAVAYARTLLHNPAAAEDAAQDAFVQAWHDLPRLNEPAVFGSWLRRLVFKFCDRTRRSARPTLPLEETLPLPADQEPVFIVERAAEAAQVREAIDALPCPLREVTLLYYLTGHDVKEIALFLAVPPSTVKNRLHAARKRLRKELWTMAETLLEEEKPSQDETFAENVLARVLREFQQQEAADPHQVNRDLLDEGRTVLFQRLAENVPLDFAMARDGLILLWRKWDFEALTNVLMRYLAQPLSDSEATWAYLHLANAIAMSGSAAGAVLAHETFERWLPGKSPCLSGAWPYTPVDNAVDALAYVGEEVRLLFLAQSGTFSTAYLGVWRNNDYLAKIDAVLSEIPIRSQHSLMPRFYVLRMASNACESAGKFDRSEHYVQQMHILATHAEETSLQRELQANALGHDIRLARCKRNEGDFLQGVTRLTTLLDVAVTELGQTAEWIRGQRHDLACELVWDNRHALALPLWEANAASGGQLGGWGWLMYAATLWQLTHDRERVLALLQEARAHDDRDMTPLFTDRPEFADVRDDPQFLSAVQRS